MVSLGLVFYRWFVFIIVMFKFYLYWRKMGFQGGLLWWFLLIYHLRSIFKFHQWRFFAIFFRFNGWRRVSWWIFLYFIDFFLHFCFLKFVKFLSCLYIFFLLCFYMRFSFMLSFLPILFLYLFLFLLQWWLLI